MAKETQKEKIVRLESELAAMTEQRDSYRDDANNFKKQISARVEETDLYKSIVRQLHEMENQRNTASEQRDRYKAKIQSLEDERESWATSASEAAQNTTESVPDVQDTAEPEEAKNCTQGSTEAIEEPLPENEKERLCRTNKQLQWLNLQLMQLLEDIGVPQDTVERLLSESENLLDGVPKRIQEFSEKWKKDMVSKLEETYETNNRPLSDEVAANIIATWCSTPRAEQALKLLYIHFMSPLDEYDEEEYKQFTKRQEEQAKIEKQEQIIAGLQAKIESAETTEQYNSVAGNYKLVNEQAKKIKGLETERDIAVKALDTIKNDLDNLRAEYEQATRHNARGAGRKPKLTDDQEQEIQKLRATGLSVRQIAAKMSCSTGLVCKILHNCINS